MDTQMDTCSRSLEPGHYTTAMRGSCAQQRSLQIGGPNRPPGPAQFDHGLVVLEIQLRPRGSIRRMDPAAVPHDIEVGPRPDREAEAGVRAEVPRHAVVLRVEGENNIGREGEASLLLPELFDEVSRRQ